MDILFFSINIIGCLVNFIYSVKSHQVRQKSYIDSSDETSTLEKLDKRLAKLESQIHIPNNQKS